MKGSVVGFALTGRRELVPQVHCRLVCSVLLSHFCFVHARLQLHILFNGYFREIFFIQIFNGPTCCHFSGFSIVLTVSEQLVRHGGLTQSRTRERDELNYPNPNTTNSPTKVCSYKSTENETRPHIAMTFRDSKDVNSRQICRVVALVCLHTNRK